MAQGRKEGQDQGRAVERTYEVSFVEVVHYRVKFTSPKVFDEHDFDPETGVETWFTEMDRRTPGWAQRGFVEVIDRNVHELKRVRRRRRRKA